MKKQLALAVALAAAPFAAFAGGHSYTYIEAGYARLDQELPSPAGFDVDDIEAGGFYLAGSVAVAPSIHVFGAYRDGDDDVGISLPSGGEIASASVDMSQGVLGVGWHHDLRERTDLVAASWLPALDATPARVLRLDIGAMRFGGRARPESAGW